jgi:hypothetical protein
LISLCSRLEPDDPSRSAIADLLDKGIDWERVIAAAQEERVTPLLYHALKLFPDRMPESAREQLKRIYLQNTGRNLRLFHEVAPILQEIDARGLRMAVTRGARLAETVYRDPGLRPFADIDFMAHPDDLGSIQDLLKGLGLWEDSYAARFEGSGRRRMMWVMETGFRKDSCQIDIHFHWPGIEVPLDLHEDLWRDVRTTDLGGSKAGIFSLEDELCILCLHSQKHNYTQLLWLTDIAETAVLDSLDWDRLENLGRERDMLPSLFHGLSLVERIWPGTLPSGALLRLRPSHPAKRMLDRVWPEEDVIHRRFSTSEAGRAQVLFLFFSARNLFPKIKALWHVLFPPQAYVAFAYNIPLRSCKMYRHYVQRLLMPLRLLRNPSCKEG